ncbi:acyl-CoA dehydrogenase family protein, partial [Cellulomonas oligotrophica]|uniref:acyl-CoA dehydrogenase family protein n=1 Tax=Cellulomonas oligotrophica TaxID=931536 RepID=UPI0031EE198A
FSDVRVPAANLLGQEGMGFVYLMQNLPRERLSIAVAAVAAVELVIAQTKQYCLERKAFGRPIGKFQNTRFELAEMATEAQIARVFVDRCITEHLSDALSVEHAAMAKWWTTELQVKVVDRCLQLHGGYGYMTEYRVARAWMDARVTRIWAGSNEIMKELIGRDLGL